MYFDVYSGEKKAQVAADVTFVFSLLCILVHLHIYTHTLFCCCSFSDVTVTVNGAQIESLHFIQNQWHNGANCSLIVAYI